MRHFNDLTPSEAERLALLLEEMGECQQVIGKILRHGYESWNPDDEHSVTNRRLLEKELGDVAFAVLMMQDCRDISEQKIIDRRREKAAKVDRYLHHNRVTSGDSPVKQQGR